MVYDFKLKHKETCEDCGGSRVVKIDLIWQAPRFLDIIYVWLYRVNKHSNKHFKLATEIPCPVLFFLRILHGFLWWMSHSSLVLELASSPSTTLFLWTLALTQLTTHPHSQHDKYGHEWHGFAGVLLRFFTIPILNRCLFLLCYFGGVSWWKRFVIPSNHPSSDLSLKQTLKDGKRLGCEGELFWTEKCWDPLTLL